MGWVIVLAVFIILGLMPLFILLAVALKDLRETRKKIKQNEKEIQEIIYKNKERKR